MEMSIVQYQQERDDEPYTTSEVIADGTGIGHRKLRDTIRKYQTDFESFGLLASYQAESTGGRPTTGYLLNEQQATFLLTLLKNTPIVVQFKRELVRQFYEMRAILWEQQHPSIQSTVRKMMVDEESRRAGFLELAEQMAQASRNMFFVDDE